MGKGVSGPARRSPSKGLVFQKRQPFWQNSHNRTRQEPQKPLLQKRGRGSGTAGTARPTAPEPRPSGTLRAAPGLGVHAHPARSGGAPSRGHADRTACATTSPAGKVSLVHPSHPQEHCKEGVRFVRGRDLRALGQWCCPVLFVVLAACERPVVDTQLSHVHRGGRRGLRALLLVVLRCHMACLRP